MKLIQRQNGQTLVMLLFFVVIALTITTAAITMLLVNGLAGTKVQEGTIGYYTAESGIENAMMRLLRNPSYTGETLTTPDGVVVIQVTGGSGNPYIITAKSTTGNFSRTVQVTASYNNTILSITSWKEVF